MISGVLAVAGLTWRESWRGRLWLVPLGAAAVLAIIAPNTDSSDSGGAARLLIVATAIAAGSCAMLIAALVPATQLTRDFESRIALTVLPKPLPRVGWLLGRWLGTLAMCGATALLVTMVGSLAITWRTGSVTEARSVTRPDVDSFARLTGLGEAVRTAGGVTRLAGPAGDGARWIFSGLDSHASSYEVLLRARVSHSQSGESVSAPVHAVAVGPDGIAMPLVLDSNSPYGRAPTEAAMLGVTCWLANRAPDRTSLATDWARLRIPTGAITSAGRLTIRLTRLDAATTIEIAHDGCAIASPAGPQPVHAALAVLAELAAPAVIAALALLVASVASLPVTLLAALSLAFAGHALWSVQEVLSWGELSRPMARLLELGIACIPDLHALGQGVRLAAGEAITWQHIGHAWLSILPHLLVLLGLGWWAISRRQL